MKFIGALIVITIAGACWLWTDLGLANWLPFIKHCQTVFAEHYGNQPQTVICSFFCLFTLIAALGLPGASLMMLIAGASFGLFWGTVFSLLASTAGATLSMLCARHFLRAWAERRFGRKLAEIDAGFAREGAFYLFGLRMAPIIPFAILNPLIGLTTMKTWTYVWVSALGMAASTAAYVNAGGELARLETATAIITPSLLLALALLGVLPLLLNKALKALRQRLASSVPDMGG